MGTPKIRPHKQGTEIHDGELDHRGGYRNPLHRSSVCSGNRGNPSPIGARMRGCGPDRDVEQEGQRAAFDMREGLLLVPIDPVRVGNFPVCHALGRELPLVYSRSGEEHAATVG